jgi:redox-sensitive bicupin YhaK (pirin superfamily)
MNHQHQYTIEKVKKVKSVEMREETGVWGKRLLPSNFMRSFDPFVKMDEFFVEPPGSFPTQINKGFECITYILDGEFQFKDDKGEIRNISEGGLQRFTAGKGFQNSLKPIRNGVNRGIRLWIKLPNSLKDQVLSHQYLEDKDIPYEETQVKLVKKISGKKTPLELHAKVQFKEVILAKNTFIKFDMTENDRGFIYVVTGINGTIRVNDTVIEPGEGLFFENIHELMVNCRDKACRFLFIAGLPYGETFKIKDGIVE